MIVENNAGQQISMSPPEGMVSWLVGMTVGQLAAKEPILQKTPLSVLVGENLYRQWRKENYIHITKAVVTMEDDRTLSESKQIGFLIGEFNVEIWRRLVTAAESGIEEIIDLPMPNGGLRTFTAKVIEIEKTERLDNDVTKATVVLLIRSTALLFPAHASYGRILMLMNKKDALKALTLALFEEKWAGLMPESSDTFISRRNIKVTHDSQLLDPVFEAEIKLSGNDQKTVLQLAVKSEPHLQLKSVTTELVNSLKKRLQMPVPLH
jgi:hypothetical protein